MNKNSKHYLKSVLLTCLSLLIPLNLYARTILGIDQIQKSPYIQYIKGKNIALITNLASQNSTNIPTYDIFKSNKNWHLSAVFTPEHGLSAHQDSKIKDPQNKQQTVPIYSLYGPRSKPTKQQLKNIDVIVFDLQDVGLRYYTFISTLGRMVETSAQFHIPLVVLDRPDPLGEHVISGDITAANRTGHFTSYFAIPTRYGMTSGELAQYYNHSLKNKAELHVITMKGWHRNMLWPDTGLTWHAPSPALTSFKQVYLYATFGPLESLRLAVGRSLNNKSAFRRFGAPYITQQQATSMARQLNHYNFNHLYFSPVSWRPSRGIFEGKQVNGIEVTIGDLHGINANKVQYATVSTLYDTLGDQIKLHGIDGMEGNSEFRQAIEQHFSYQQWLNTYQREQSRYLAKRAKALLYKP